MAGAGNINAGADRALFSYIGSYGLNTEARCDQKLNVLSSYSANK